MLQSKLTPTLIFGPSVLGVVAGIVTTWSGVVNIAEKVGFDVRLSIAIAAVATVVILVAGYFALRAQSIAAGDVEPPLAGEQRAYTPTPGVGQAGGAFLVGTVISFLLFLGVVQVLSLVAPGRDPKDAAIERLRGELDASEANRNALTSGVCQPRPIAQVIDNFDTVRPGGREFVWPRCDTINSGHIAPVLHAPVNGCSYLEIAYLIPEPGASGGWGIVLDGFDATRTQLTRLVLHVRGAQGGERFDIGLKDRRGVELKVPSTRYLARISTVWQRLEVPLADFPTVDRSALDNVNVAFDFSHREGAIFLDHIGFD